MSAPRFGRCLVLACAGLAAGACPGPGAGSSFASHGSCAAPRGARGVVLALTRFVVPHAGDASREVAELTVDGACTADVECARVSAAAFERLARSLAALGRMRTVERVSSPHYGARFLELRWDGGSCSAADSQERPLARDDARRFGDVFSAAIDLVLAARPPEATPR